MSVLYLLVPLALAVVAAAIGAFVWATRKGQFDDVVTPALRALRDDGEPPPPNPPREGVGAEQRSTR